MHQSPKLLTDPQEYFCQRMDIIRLLSISSIIWGHCLFKWESTTFNNDSLSITQVMFLQTGRLGTICFFMLAGYFLHDKLGTFTVKSYLKSRLYTVIIPWAIFLLLFVIIQLFHMLSAAELLQSPKVFSTAVYLLKVFVFHSSYWFVPAAILCGCVMVIFKRYLYHWWFGALLMGITLFYCLNLYTGWVAVNHTKAVFGYAIFVWLGIQLKTYRYPIFNAINQTSWLTIFIVLTTTFFIACAEIVALKKIGSHDPYASIRLSNIIFSLLLFCAFLKTDRFDKLRRLKPRKYVYGLYLIHSIVISEIIPLLVSSIRHFRPGPVLLLSLHIIFFGLVFAVTYGITVLIKSSPIRPILGR